MNEPAEQSATPPPLPELISNVRKRRRAGYWVKRCLLCNPCYLLSAALLLFGIYRVSVEPAMLDQELTQLRFNFTSLQFYELLLVLTALFLARRKVWYDLTLLVVLESMFVLVPFILISQAALIDETTVWALCLLAGLIAVVRYGVVKWRIPILNFPARFLTAGLAVLLVNVALPIVYRTLHESKVGTRPDWGAAYHTNQLLWLLLLPALCGLVHFLPASRRGALPPQGRFLPLGLFSLWILATGVHLYCLGYVYDFALRADLMTPAIWLLLWLAWQRVPELAPAWAGHLQKTFLVLPLLAPLLAGGRPGKAVFVSLLVLNSVLYATLYWRGRGGRLALHLAVLSVVLLLAGLPLDWLRQVGIELTRTRCLTVSLGLYLLAWMMASKNPGAGLIASLLIFLGVMVLARSGPLQVPWALQLALAFLLGHSLRWDDGLYQPSKLLRGIAAGIWVMHAFWWLRASGQPWMACAIATPVLGYYFGLRIVYGGWRGWVVPAAGVLVMLSGPIHALALSMSKVSSGILAIGASFVLLGLGTLAALTKERWLKLGAARK